MLWLLQYTELLLYLPSQFCHIIIYCNGRHCDRHFVITHVCPIIVLSFVVVGDSPSLVPSTYFPAAATTAASPGIVDCCIASTASPLVFDCCVTSFCCRRHLVLVVVSSHHLVFNVSSFVMGSDGPLLRCVHLFPPRRRCPSSCCWFLRLQLMDHGLKGGGREGAGQKEGSIIVVVCISLDFLLLACLPRWIDTKNW